ncbi:MAG: Ribosomal RNA small subunit methyltransferase I [Candidatus Jorgensenbacteria bacterium GW2011_GWA1_48_13]|uniref:Ribosomal RNA small subunit methyltransferase I n=1 Tax=Candidatus Jorgensenbacteria bacterium GW2011_GWB1_50_10 TaxID=1618665 RepID=A0A0G1W972_9BACT|nr:MAG: Ribosomal RNA small subunit methyltransferase I [Candidatus Jorgensenbacteria bacterium GW2011_GWA1_48_13]KKW15115.1 MAG: Ribosomal RNA small subunit methyltransferase I [Candidatus Jorgensenbacteria bacterium GW2011_GWB1_50_10]
MGTLYIVATPIGNLKDITLRALETLKGADLILAEDTRVIQKLLFHYEIKRLVKRYDEYSRLGIYEEIKEKLKKGGNVALVADAGTPGIADPGSKLVEFIKKELPGVSVTPLPGASAITAALSASGLRADKFTFLGYPPHKKGREKFFRSLEGLKIRPVVLYESPYRVLKALASLSQVFGPDYEIVVGRELTKIHEEIWKGSLKDAAEHFTGERKRGEFVLIIP